MNSQTLVRHVQQKFIRMTDLLRDQPAYKILDEKYQALSPLGKRLAQVGAAFVALFLVIGLLYAFFDRIVVIGFIASVLAGLATGAGALPTLFFKSVPARLFNTLLGGAAGVMLAATAFSLIVPGIQYGNAMWPGKGIFVVALGMLIGAFFLDIADRKLPHVHFVDADEQRSMSLRKIWLFVIAITIHNFPEGLAVGVSFGAGDMQGNRTKEKGDFS